MESNISAFVKKHTVTILLILIVLIFLITWKTGILGDILMFGIGAGAIFMILKARFFGK